MMASGPRVSVVMTTYNGSRYIRETIDSILNQTYRDFEFLIIDDNSSDNTVDIVEHYRDPRIRLIKNPINLGVCGSRNTGIQLARGEYLAYTDHDDISLPERLERQIAYLDEHSNVLLAGTAGWYMEEADVVEEYSGILEPYMMHWLLFTQTPLVPSSICLRLQQLHQHKIYFRPGYEYADDVDFFHRLARVGNIVSIPDRLTCYRRHEGNATRLYNANMIINGQRVYYEAYRDYLGMDMTSAEIDSIWRIFCCLQPAQDEDDLLRAGALLQQALQRYVDKKQLDDNQTSKLKASTACNWWNAVSKSARVLRKPLLIAAYWKLPQLSTVQPSFTAAAKTVTMTGLNFKPARFLHDKLNEWRRKSR